MIANFPRMNYIGAIAALVVDITYSIILNYNSFLRYKYKYFYLANLLIYELYLFFLRELNRYCQVHNKSVTILNGRCIK